VMLLRPEGLFPNSRRAVFPNSRRAAELHADVEEASDKDAAVGSPQA